MDFCRVGGITWFGVTVGFALFVMTDFCVEEDAIPAPCEAETEAGSEGGGFNESDEADLREALVDSERAGHETAPITAPPTASTAPFEGLFQTCFLPALLSE